MTEPGAGSDLQGIQTRAVDHGDHFILNGAKTFISNGINADLVIVVARTAADAGHRGISLLVVERGMAGFERGRNLAKIGLHAQDTAELSFDGVRVPRENLLGDLGTGFISLMRNLPQERLSIAVMAAAGIEGALASGTAYAKARTAFGKPIGEFQHNRFLLAELATDARVARSSSSTSVSAFTSKGGLRRSWRVNGQVVDDGVAVQGHRPEPAATWRLWVHRASTPSPRRTSIAASQTIYGGTTEMPEGDHRTRHGLLGSQQGAESSLSDGFPSHVPRAISEIQHGVGKRSNQSGRLEARRDRIVARQRSTRIASFHKART